MIKKIVLASNNSGKIKEFSAIFKDLGIELIPQSEFEVPEIDEPFTTFVENAIHKARHCSKIANLPVIADDSGLCVTALNGAPGIHSARFAGAPKNDKANNKKLIKELAPHSNKSAYYYCVLVLMRHQLDPQPIIADGSLSGEIIDTPQGENGFGYDPHFYIPKFKQTAAQLDSTIKNQISHRAIAIKKLLLQIL